MCRKPAPFVRVFPPRAAIRRATPADRATNAASEMPLSTRSVAATNASHPTARTTSRSTAKTTAPATTTRSTATPKNAPAAATAASCSTAAATSSSGEPSRIQVLREARKAAAERERGCEALVEAANLRRDPLKQLSVPRTFRSNGLDAALEWHRGAALSDEELLFCAALLAANMRAQAKAAGWGSMVRAAPWQCPSSAPAPSQGTPGGSGQPGTPGKTPAHCALEIPATASAARASRLQSRRFDRA